jgi:putative FmdB family regulatory protein
MPVYDYVCKNCRKKFSETKSISEYDPKAARCPKCRSRRVERVLSRIQVETSKKS